MHLIYVYSLSYISKWGHVTLCIIVQVKWSKNHCIPNIQYCAYNYLLTWIIFKFNWQIFQVIITYGCIPLLSSWYDTDMNISKWYWYRNDTNTNHLGSNTSSATIYVFSYVLSYISDCLVLLTSAIMVSDVQSSNLKAWKHIYFQTFTKIFQNHM